MPLTVVTEALLLVVQTAVTALAVDMGPLVVLAAVNLLAVLTEAMPLMALTVLVPVIEAR